MRPDWSAVGADSTRMEWGGLISTCNKLAADTVTVETDAPLLWTTEVQEPPRDSTRGQPS